MIILVVIVRIDAAVYDRNRAWPAPMFCAQLIDTLVISPLDAFDASFVLIQTFISLTTGRNIAIAHWYFSGHAIKIFVIIVYSKLMH